VLNKADENTAGFRELLQILPNNDSHIVPRAMIGADDSRSLDSAVLRLKGLPRVRLSQSKRSRDSRWNCQMKLVFEKAQRAYQRESRRSAADSAILVNRAAQSVPRGGPPKEEHTSLCHATPFEHADPVEAFQEA
jgi:hypothetical protein